MKAKKIGIMYYLKRYKLQVFLFCLCIAVSCAFDSLSVILIANSLTKITAGNLEGGLRLIMYCLCLCLLKRGCWYWSNYLYYKYSNILCGEISQDLTKRCFELSSSTFSENNSGSFVQRIINDPQQVVGQLADLVDLIANLLSALAIVIYLICLDPIIGTIYIVVIFLLFLLERLRLKMRKKNRLSYKKIADKTYSLIQEVVQSEKDIKALNLENKLSETTKSELDKMKNSNYHFSMTDCSFWSARNLFVEVFGLLILVLGVKMMERDLITMSMYILIFSYRNDIYQVVWCSGTIAQIFTDIGVHSSRMFSLFDENVYPTDKFGTRKIRQMKGKIEFKKVGFAYTEIKEDEEGKKSKKNKKKEIQRIKKDPIFTELSFVIEPNSTVAFVGKSGSGKSTILSLISKMVDVDSGKILIDNVNINDIEKNCLRENLSLINQFPYIFDMTIKENLLLVKKDATDEEIIDVLKKASLYDDVETMPNGINTKVGESGVKLSGGQRQRLAIARALLKQSKIIIFDESTSSLDNFAQSKVQHSIENLKGGHTVIIVAHRLSTIKNVDKIFFLDEGKIIASGTFDELFKNNQQFQDMFLIENI
ncbi:MAG: ABC transporter ATP-binding protein [Clostridia bacterium]|nr:ABC transporter ATP-binding protein [Clostridia bacterium]